MEIITEALDLESAKKLINDGIHNLVLGSSEFGVRNCYDFKIEEIKELVANKQNTKIWIKANSFIFEDVIDKLTQYLEELSQLDIDYVIFQDYAIPQINKELNLNLELHYNPETLNTNYGQLDFFREHKFTGCFIARELMLNELTEICKHKGELKIEVQAFGFAFIMHSRWSLISNFDKYYNSNIMDKNYIEIKENLRKIPNVIFEDNAGTHMMTGYILNLISMLKKLNEIGVDLIQINLLKLPKEFLLIVNIFMDATNNVNNPEFDESKYIELIDKVISKKYIESTGFLGGIKQILHMQKEEYNE
ncbi:MAG: U32 family peptidase [Mycoplasma sp.]